MLRVVCAVVILTCISITVSSLKACPKGSTYECKDKLSKEQCERIFPNIENCTADDLEIEDWAKLCLSHCRMCCHDDQFNCDNKKGNTAEETAQINSACEVFKLLGVCTKANMKHLMAIECPKTCGICNYKGQQACLNSLPTSECRRMEYYCKVFGPVGNLVRKKCPFTCGCPIIPLPVYTDHLQQKKIENLGFLNYSLSPSFSE